MRFEKKNPGPGLAKKSPSGNASGKPSGTFREPSGTRCFLKEKKVFRVLWAIKKHKKPSGMHVKHIQTSETHVSLKNLPGTLLGTLAKPSGNLPGLEVFRMSKTRSFCKQMSIK